LYPFFDLHNVPIKAVKTDLPFIVSFFVEYPYYRKIGGPALSHIRYQQNLTIRTIALVVLGNPQWPILRLHMERVVAAVNAARPGSYTEVEIPER
jgi:hypothetical protein